jgi:hypothetical protein
LGVSVLSWDWINSRNREIIASAFAQPEEGSAAGSGVWGYFEGQRFAKEI